jgi:hypothetical protein
VAHAAVTAAVMMVGLKAIKPRLAHAPVLLLKAITARKMTLSVSGFLWVLLHAFCFGREFASGTAE